MSDKPQNNQNNPKEADLQLNAFDEEESLDELWDAALNSPTVKKPEPLIGSASGVLDWGDLDSAEIWDDIVNSGDAKAPKDEKKVEEDEKKVEEDEKKVESDAVSVEEEKPKEPQAATPQKAPEAFHLGLSQLNFDNLNELPEEAHETDENAFANATVALQLDVLEKFAETEEAKDSEGNHISAGGLNLDLLGNKISDSEEKQPEDSSESDSEEDSSATVLLEQPHFDDIPENAENAENAETNELQKEEESKSSENEEDEIDDDSPTQIKFSNRMSSGVFTTDDEPTMTERARMGKVEPEGEVITSDHKLGTDVYYPDSECIPQLPSNNFLVKYVIIAAIVLVAVAGVLLYLSTREEKLYPYPQQFGFNVTHNHFDHVYSSPSGRLIGLCSDTRGVLTSNRQTKQIAADFWPGLQGCAGMRVSKDGSTIYYIDNSNKLYAVDLSKTNGFSPSFVTTLQNIYGNEFNVTDKEIVYFAQANNHIVFRHHNISTNDIQDVELPPDALPCDGIFDNNYGFVSKHELNLVNWKSSDEKSDAVDLERYTKYGCSRIYTKSCAITEKLDWSVLCDESIHLGHGIKEDIPVQYSNIGIISGADPFKLIPHAEGAELITASEWVKVRNGSTDITPLSSRLSSPFEAVYTYDSQKPILGTIDGNYMRIDTKGVVSLNIPHQISGAVFVGNGNSVVTFSQNNGAETEGLQTEISLWNITEGQLLKADSLPGEINAVNISNLGQYGFILSENQQKLNWFSWTDLKNLGTISAEQDIVDAIWSDDDQYVLIQYVDNSSTLFARKDNQFVELRKYASDVTVAFAHDGLLWHGENHQVSTERIEDGELSVIYNVISEGISDANNLRIYTHPNNDLAIIWADEGLWVYNIGKNELQQIVDLPITWISPNRTGNKLASNVGIIDLASLQITPLPDAANTRKLRWTGAGNYLQSEDGNILISLKHNHSLQSLPSMDGIRVIGYNTGEHPSADLILANRDIISTIEYLDDIHHPQILGAFAGNSTEDWCWQIPSGELQNKGETFCKPYKQKEAKLPSSDPAISAFMQKALSSQPEMLAFKHSPIDFINQSNLTITTIPEITGLTFVSAGGDLQAPLQFEEGFTLSPFNATLNKDDVTWIALAVTAENYVERTVAFQANTKDINLRIPLLPTGAVNTTSFAMFDTSEEVPAELEVSENLSIEFRAIAYEHYSALKACASTLPNHTLQFVMNSDQKLILDPKQSNIEECGINEVLQDIDQRREQGALPELNGMDEIQINLGIN